MLELKTEMGFSSADPIILSVLIMNAEPPRSVYKYLFPVKRKSRKRELAQPSRCLKKFHRDDKMRYPNVITTVRHAHSQYAKYPVGQLLSHKSHVFPDTLSMLDSITNFLTFTLRDLEKSNSRSL